MQIQIQIHFFTDSYVHGEITSAYATDGARMGNVESVNLRL